MRARHRLPFTLALALIATAVSACGGSDGTTHPDTGYGANQPVPTTVNCTDFCARAADCGSQLCNEDTMSTNYTALAPLLAGECQSACTAPLLAQLTPTVWQCYFQSSCRQIFEDNVCHVSNASYTCN